MYLSFYHFLCDLGHVRACLLALPTSPTPRPSPLQKKLNWRLSFVFSDKFIAKIGQEIIFKLESNHMLTNLRTFSHLSASMHASPWDNLFLLVTLQFSLCIDEEWCFLCKCQDKKCLCSKFQLKWWNGSGVMTILVFLLLQSVRTCIFWASVEFHRGFSH